MRLLNYGLVCRLEVREVGRNEEEGSREEKGGLTVGVEVELEEAKGGQEGRNDDRGLEVLFL